MHQSKKMDELLAKSSLVSITVAATKEAGPLESNISAIIMGLGGAASGTPAYTRALIDAYGIREMELSETDSRNLEQVDLLMRNAVYLEIPEGSITSDSVETMKLVLEGTEADQEYLDFLTSLIPQ